VVFVKAWHISTAAPFTLDGPKGQVHAMIVAKDTHTLLAGAEVNTYTLLYGCYQDILDFLFSSYH